MKKFCLIIMLLLTVVSTLFCGCYDVNTDVDKDLSVSTMDEDTKILLEYEYDNFVELITNRNFQAAEDYWNDNYELHLDESAIEYHNYNCGMLCLANGYLGRALDYFNTNLQFLDSSQQIDKINKEISVFNGIYKYENLDDIYLVINNGYADIIVDIDNSQPIYYSRLLFRDENNKYSICYDSENNENLEIVSIADDSSYLILKSTSNSKNKVYDGKYNKISNEPLPIKVN